MKKKTYKIMVRIIILFLQFSVIIGAAILEYLAPKKMGVARYLLFKKDAYAATLFSPELIKIYTVILLAGLILCLILIIGKALKGQGRKTISIILAAIYHLIGIFLLSDQNINAYPFFIFGILIVIIFQYLRIILSAKKEK